jgi:hypothetical protein
MVQRVPAGSHHPEFTSAAREIRTMSSARASYLKMHPKRKELIHVSEQVHLKWHVAFYGKL